MAHKKGAEADNGGRSQLWRGRIRTVLCFLVGAAVLWPYAFSLGAEGATFTLVNRTPYFLHAVINNKPSIYIPPGGVVNYDANGTANIIVDVRYSPGQGVKGSVLRTFEIVFHTTTTSSGNTSSTCNEQGNDCDTSTESSVTVTADPVTWIVTQSDLTAR
jgi:hypothetical protein